MADFMSLVNNVVGLNQYTANTFANIFSHSGGAPAVQNEHHSDNPLADVEAIGGASPQYPQEAAFRLQPMQQGFAEIEREWRDGVEQEVDARTDAWYAQQMGLYQG